MSQCEKKHTNLILSSCWDRHGLVGLSGLMLYNAEVGIYDGEAGLYDGEVGLYAGEVGLYAGEVGLYPGDADGLCDDELKLSANKACRIFSRRLHLFEL